MLRVPVKQVVDHWTCLSEKALLESISIGNTMHRGICDIVEVRLSKQVHCREDHQAADATEEFEVKLNSSVASAA